MFDIFNLTINQNDESVIKGVGNSISLTDE